jgi:NitT/TauT family transport system substrate-binding protein
MQGQGMKPAGKLFIIVVIVGILIWAIALGPLHSLIPEKATPAMSADVEKLVDSGTPVINVALNTWMGWAGGPYFNGGMTATKDSRYFKEEGLLVNFIVQDEIEASRAAWRKGSIDLLWITTDAFTTEAKALLDEKPKQFIQVDWSRGGDAIVAKAEVTSVNDLVGRKVACAIGAPSNSYLLAACDIAGVNYGDISVVPVKSGIEAASMFKAGQCDAAVVWAPDDADCVKSVEGAKVLSSTKTASKIIADGFVVKDEYMAKHKDILIKFARGWLKGNAAINSSGKDLDRAAAIMAAGFNVPVPDAKAGILNAHLVTYGDNRNFFNVDGDFKGVKGEDIYTKFSKLYGAINLAPADNPSWRQISTSEIITAFTLTGPQNAAEGMAEFTPPTEKEKTAPAFAAKKITVNFATGSALLTDESKAKIRFELGTISNMFADARVRIEGNTDNVGGAALNRSLSKRRAQSVADFLVERFKFDDRRFIVEGNGPDKPVATNDTEAGRAANRRTEFQILQ